ncbi:AraC family transcriptional regulator [Agarivorans sp. Alg241-V36]|uniref:AraC family transcriptional regulator n=1 Tax=Agarivorans sp. Alg241-V36 TaxID=2305992 RepID=UPI0013D38020|nr:AraC family transcriptional regulator [Agarivorans sp. Alg241-V36]
MLKPVNISSSNNLTPFLNYFDQKGIEWQKVAAQYDFPEDIKLGNYWLPSSQVMGFLHAMVQHSKRNIGYEVGRLITLDQISPQLLAGFSCCKTLDQASHRLIEMMPSLNNYVVVWPQNIGGRWFLCHRGSYHPSLPGYDQAEWFRTFALISLCRRFLGSQWEPESVFMSFPEHLARSVLHTTQSKNFSFDHEFGAVEVPLSATFTPIENKLRKSDWLVTITALIETYAGLPWFNLDWLAALVGSSSRSLQRQFAAKGQSFRYLRDQARSLLACEMLKANLTPFETAWRCGYSDLSNFNRAFKGWHNQTPAQYQRSHKGGE